MRMSRFYKKSMYHHNGEAEMLVCLLILVILFIVNSSSNMIFIKPHVFFKINFTGVDKSEYNISSFSCKDLENKIHIGTNITFPSNEQSFHNLIFRKNERQATPDHVSLSPLDLSSNKCLWGDEIPLRIKYKMENTEVGFYIPESGIYIIKEYFHPQMYSQNYK